MDAHLFVGFGAVTPASPNYTASGWVMLFTVVEEREPGLAAVLDFMPWGKIMTAELTSLTRLWRTCRPS